MQTCHPVYQHNENNSGNESETAVESDERSEKAGSLKLKRDELKASTDTLAAANTTVNYGRGFCQVCNMQHATCNREDETSL